MVKGTAPNPEASRKCRIAVWTVVAVILVGMGVGIGFGVRSGSKLHDEVAQLKDEVAQLNVTVNGNVQNYIGTVLLHCGFLRHFPRPQCTRPVSAKIIFLSGIP